jgi:hypothetical protein
MRPSRRMRAFLKCFVTVVVAFVAVVLAVSNGASATRLTWSVVGAIEHAPQELGHRTALLICVAGVLLGALLISAHRHLDDRIPGDTKWLLGGGVTALLAALVLAFDLSGLHRRAQGGTNQPVQPPTISAETPQPASGNEGEGAPTHSENRPASGTTKAVDYAPTATDESESPAPSATAHDAAVFVPSAESQEQEPVSETEGPSESSEEEPTQSEETTVQAEGAPATQTSASTTAVSYTSMSATATTNASVSGTAGIPEATSEADGETMPEGGCGEE